MNNELIAVPVYQNRISPLLDVSDKYVIFETENGEVKQKINISLNVEGEPQRVEKLKEIGVNTIICGAVSGCVARIVYEKGIRLISMIYGPIEEIINQYLSNSLATNCPENTGCAYKKRKRRGQCAGADGRQKIRGKK
jgi:predicted Fe-Mo cluster-binding NifX family protein